MAVSQSICSTGDSTRPQPAMAIQLLDNSGTDKNGAEVLSCSELWSWKSFFWFRANTCQHPYNPASWSWEVWSHHSDRCVANATTPAGWEMWLHPWAFMWMECHAFFMRAGVSHRWAEGQGFRKPPLIRRCWIISLTEGLVPLPL